MLLSAKQQQNRLLMRKITELTEHVKYHWKPLIEPAQLRNKRLSRAFQAAAKADRRLTEPARIPRLSHMMTFFSCQAATSSRLPLEIRISCMQRLAAGGCRQKLLANMRHAV